MNKFFFQIDITDEQVEYTKKLVEHSLKYHTVTDIFANDPNGKKRQYDFRFIGSLGEVVFADTYELPRPTKSFGATDGQDYGEDFVLEINGSQSSIDIKSMKRKSNILRKDYVLNIPKYQLDKNHKTDYYFHISIHQENDKYIASFLGYVKKPDIQNKTIGTLYNEGSIRTKDNGEKIKFQRDTYEILFKDFYSPIINHKIENMQGYKVNQLK